MKKKFAVLCLTMIACGAAQAEYPNKPIRVVIGFAAGGASDIAFRMVQDDLSKRLGQPVVPDYRPGANGNIANDIVAGAAPDGYTVLWANVGPLATNHYLYANSKTDPARAFDAVTQLTDSALVVVVPKDSPYKTMRELIAAGRTKPGGLMYGSAGSGSSMHIAGASLSVALGVPMTHVPYKGSAPASQDLLAGRLDFMADSRSTTTPHIRQGTLRALAVTGGKRVAEMPDVPTVAESGVPGFEVTTWQGIVVPKGTPPDVIRKLSDAMRATLATPLVRERFAGINTATVGSSPAEFAAFMEAERQAARVLVEKAKLRID